MIMRDSESSQYLCVMLPQQEVSGMYSKKKKSLTGVIIQILSYCIYHWERVKKGKE